MCFDFDTKINTSKMRNYKVKFTAKNITGNAGLVHLGKFAEKLQIPKTLKKVISIQRGHTANYDVSNRVVRK